VPKEYDAWLIGEEVKDHVSYGIAYLPEASAAPFEVWSGSAWDLAGREVSAKELLTPKWHQLVTGAKAEWFLPFVKRIVEGEVVSTCEIEKAYRKSRKQKMKRTAVKR
jgi:hypothetical protein